MWQYCGGQWTNISFPPFLSILGLIVEAGNAIMASLFIQYSVGQCNVCWNHQDWKNVFKTFTAIQWGTRMGIFYAGSWGYIYLFQYSDQWPTGVRSPLTKISLGLLWQTWGGGQHILKVGILCTEYWYCNMDYSSDIAQSIIAFLTTDAHTGGQYYARRCKAATQSNAQCASTMLLWYTYNL